MLTPMEIGKRIKKVREARNMTLKKVEGLAGVSATHISEIERGKTSPTVGSLIKIAGALEKDPSYFIEEDELQDISFVALEGRVEVVRTGPRGREQKLTRGIPGGCLNACRVILEPGGREEAAGASRDGDCVFLVLRGSLRLRLEGETHVLEEGDSAYCLAGVEHSFSNPSRDAPAEFLWVATDRGRP